MSVFLWVLAACLLLSGFTNIGIALASKELNFAVEFKYMVGIKLTGIL
ncbi:MAG: hypothetical protein IPN53_14735 [Comamonadaceae bacterium]|nr:hypothetical protein [Comamonadaceae bacterium]